MGSIPRQVYVALALPAHLDSEFVLAFYEGPTALAEHLRWRYAVVIPWLRLVPGGKYYCTG